MREIILHYLWLHSRFDVLQLYTTKNEKIEILNFGQYLQNSGPDFFNAQLIIGNQRWAGNIEIHVNSSDWYLHHHQVDDNYNNVILHVVWNHDVEIYRIDETEIPVLELKKFVSRNTIDQINELLQKKNWINCENAINDVSNFIWFSWKERLFFERLEEKSKAVFSVFNKLNKDWEATCFAILAKGYGLNVNGEMFQELVSSTPFSIVRKEALTNENLEALFFGKANMISKNYEDEYVKLLQDIWEYQKIKYGLEENENIKIQFYKLRPDNFPTIRIAQLVSLFVWHKNLFEKIIEAKSVSEIEAIFKVKVSEYWQNHYNFDKDSKKRSGLISKDFIQLLVVNVIIPLKFSYLKYIGERDFENLFDLVRNLSVEQNGIIDRFKKIGVNCDNAFDSQALLQLKKRYCEQQSCLKCGIGVEILKKNHTFEV